MKIVMLLILFTFFAGCDKDSKRDPGRAFIHLGTPACNGGDVCK